jgi:UDP-N-acetylglucosamine 4-epimerase
MSQAFAYVASAIQFNLLVATTENEDAVNDVYNTAIGERTTLNKLYVEIQRILLPLCPQLRDSNPQYRDVCEEDVCHGRADIGNARSKAGDDPVYHLARGLELAMPWYVAQARV